MDLPSLLCAWHIHHGHAAWGCQPPGGRGGGKARLGVVVVAMASGGAVAARGVRARERQDNKLHFLLQTFQPYMRSPGPIPGDHEFHLFGLCEL